MPDERSRRAVETLERAADGLCGEPELQATRSLFDDDDIHSRLGEAQSYALSAALTCVMDRQYRLAGVARSYCEAAMSASQGRKPVEESPELQRDYCDLIRELFGNPFRPVRLDPVWQAPTIIALAQGAYDNHILPAGTLDTARLAVLADALEEAGCTDAELLGHLRGPGPHVRGCWVVDLLLGKE
jgi:hypothetical protein